MTSPSTAELLTKTEFELAMARLDTRSAALDARIDTRFAQLETLIERSSVTSIRWIVGLTFGLYALMFGLILFVVSRELPRA